MTGSSRDSINRVLNVSSELTPFAKAGGLGDAVAALAKELANLGDDVRILMPKYGFLDAAQWKPHEEPLIVNLGYAETKYGKIWETKLTDSEVRVYLLEYNQYYEYGGIYPGDDMPESTRQERFAFLCRAAIDLCDFLDWTPDIIHCHDWPAALTPVMLSHCGGDHRLANTASVYTIHNLEHQGYCSPSVLDFAGIPLTEFRSDSLESYAQVNPVKGALYHSNKLTTVSPTYAQEIQTEQYGCGLEKVLRFRAADLIGVVNGIDTKVWNPANDRHLPNHFSADDLSGKQACKNALRHRYGLREDADRPIFGVVSRLWEQKGLDLLAGIVPRIMEEMDVQLVILGSGDSMLERQFQLLGSHFPGQVGVQLGYDESLAHLIEAGSDFFVMPSRFEPCGLNQMYSMCYGTLPIARHTGGLADTIEQYQEGSGQGTGFLFNQASYDALYYTIGWACSTYYDRRDELCQLQQNAMRKNFEWRLSAQTYRNVYQWAQQARNPLQESTVL